MKTGLAALGAVPPSLPAAGPGFPIPPHSPLGLVFWSGCKLHPGPHISTRHPTFPLLAGSP